VTSLENFRTQINTIHAKLTGELNIGITDNLVTLEYMRVSKALKTEGSEVEINIHMIPLNEIERYVLDGGLHVGVVPDLRPLPRLEYSKLHTEESLHYCNYHPPYLMVKIVI
jgi:DNA-binding transcriptional LysR family regulator